MSVVLYTSLVLLLVPIQATVLHYISIQGIRPDLCLIATCLVGFLGGQVKGLALGMGLGFVQDLFSAGGLGLNMILKGMTGILSGLAAKTLSNLSPTTIFLPTGVLSLGCGVLAMISARPQINGYLLIQDFQFIILPQALFDATLALSINWIIVKFKHFHALIDPVVSRRA